MRLSVERSSPVLLPQLDGERFHYRWSNQPSVKGAGLRHPPVLVPSGLLTRGTSMRKHGLEELKPSDSGLRSAAGVCPAVSWGGSLRRPCAMSAQRCRHPEFKRSGPLHESLSAALGEIPGVLRARRRTCKKQNYYYYYYYYYSLWQ